MFMVNALNHVAHAKRMTEHELIWMTYELIVGIRGTHAALFHMNSDIQNSGSLSLFVVGY